MEAISLRIMLCGILFASALITFLVSLHTLSRHYTVNKYFSFFGIAVSFYSFGYGMELFSNSLDQMIFWNLVQYIGLPFLPAFWILFTLDYNNKPIHLVSKLSLFLIPFLTLIFRYTSSMNHLFYLNVKMITNKYFPVLYIEKGPWYWVDSIYLTGCLLVSNYLYLQMYRKSPGLIGHQGLLILIASFLPWFSDILDLLNISPLNIDYGPFALTLSTILFFIALVQYRFLNIKPLARDKFFKSTDDGLIVLDPNYHLIDFNPSAESICPELNESVIGKTIQKVLKNYQELIDSISNFQETICSFDKPNVSYKVNTVKILDNDQEAGFIITLSDITKYMEMLEELNYLASTDALTGILNRRHFVELSLRELENAKRYHRPVSLIILDIDYFKQINDTYGHQVGDVVLKKIAGICQDTIRATDILGRYGGEEFVILLPETTLEDCRIIAKRILTTIADTQLYCDGNYIKATSSLGFTGVDSVTTETLDDFLKYADEGLYRAKDEGRNRACSILDDHESLPI